MGFERRGILIPPFSWPVVKEALRLSLIARGWRMVRDQENCLSFALPERADSPWAEDIVLCGEPLLYLLEHSRSPGDQGETVYVAIADALRSLPATVRWEEI